MRLLLNAFLLASIAAPVASQQQTDLTKNTEMIKELQEKSRVAREKGELWSLEKTRHDVTLFHPRSEYKDGRPTWLRMGGDRKPYKLPAAICGPAARCLVRARVASESEDAVPVDQIEVISGRSVPVLMLPVGEFALEVKDAADKTVKTSRIKMR